MKKQMFDGAENFNEYYDFVTKLRNKIHNNDGPSYPKSPLDFANTSNPFEVVAPNCLPHHVFNFKSDLRPVFETTSLAKIVSQFLSHRASSHLISDNFYVVPSSSVFWLQYCLHFVAQNRSESTAPVVLSTSGSFKCGGYFPQLCGLEIKYAQTKFENGFKITSQELEDILGHLRSESALPACYLIENPTALGQIYSPEELTSLCKVLNNFPEIFVICDHYHEGTEHNVDDVNWLRDFGLREDRTAEIFSFNRSLGPVAKNLNTSCLYTTDENLRKQLDHATADERFYFLPRYSRLHYDLSVLVFETICQTNFPKPFASHLKTAAGHFCSCITSVNETLATKYGGYIGNIAEFEVLSGQFGFLFLDEALQNSTGIKDSRRFAEVLAVHQSSCVLVTPVAAMGVFAPNVGVRLNLCTASSMRRNTQIMNDLRERLLDTLCDLIETPGNLFGVEQAIDDFYKGVG